MPWVLLNLSLLQLLAFSPAKRAPEGFVTSRSGMKYFRREELQTERRVLRNSPLNMRSLFVQSAELSDKNPSSLVSLKNHSCFLSFSGSLECAITGELHLAIIIVSSDCFGLVLPTWESCAQEVAYKYFRHRNLFLGGSASDHRWMTMWECWHASCLQAGNYFGKKAAIRQSI